MMMRILSVALIFGIAASLARAQEIPKPGPEHDKFKDMVGDWETTVKMAGAETKGKASYKIGFNGFFMIEEFEADFGGFKFHGRGQTGYCPVRKKYITTWIDNMDPSPLVMSGNFDKEGKTLTENGEGTREGKLVKLKSVGTMPDKDTMLFHFYEVKDGKDVEMMSITYKRKS
ncbi:MAG TPA: DUF1579 family protein [Gemmataceae bacterium]|nr:DUF1579 family protein [Gemmataceae bacterium]